jgi:thiol-disulfide isomerase/thioredoxin
MLVLKNNIKLTLLKKINFVVGFCLLSVFVIAQTKSSIVFQAEIANRNSDTVTTLDPKNGNEIVKIIVDKAGIFKNSFAVTEGLYIFFDGKVYTQMFLKNGYDLRMKMDAKQYDESIVYEGTGAEENNFLAQSAVQDKSYDYDALLLMNKEDFSKNLSNKKAADLITLDKKKLDGNFVMLLKANIENSALGLNQFYQESLKTKKLNGLVSPSFEYDNYKGRETKLEDFRGKYVYIDVWATWCAPCRAEIPFLKKLEEKYHQKNIVFVSLSIDQVKDIEKWKTLIKDKELGGVQVLADNDWNSQFVKDYYISGIPRFILVDPNGKILKADAPRPSSPTIEAEFDSLFK